MAIIIVLSSILLLILIIFLLMLYGFNRATRSKNFPENLYVEPLKENGIDVYSILESHKREDVDITSSDNLKLRGIYIQGDKALNRTMIIVHGYMVSSIWSLQFAELFLNEGWSVLLVDQRRHGRSQGKYSTYGYMEKHDLDRWVDWVIDKNGPDCTIGLHGQSMGGATVLEYAAINKHAKFIIADCPYSDMEKLIIHQMKFRHLPVYPIIYFFDYLLAVKTGFRMKEVSPIKVVEKCSIPMMFIHGQLDNFVPAYMSREMYDAKKDNKKLLIVDGAVHGTSYIVNKELYKKEMMDFVHQALENIHQV